MNRGSSTAERRWKIEQIHTASGHKRANAVISIDVGHRQSRRIVYLHAHLAIATDLQHDDGEKITQAGL
jgi:hypothetical protein